MTGNAGGPNGVINGADFTQFSAVWSVDAPVTWQTDISDSTGALGPDGVTDNGDSVAYTNFYFAGSTGGIGLISQTSVDNRKGLAGYEFDPILAGNGAPKGSAVPVYHVRNRALNSYAGKWLQRDPLGYHDSMDLYEYCGSDPCTRTDPEGLLWASKTAQTTFRCLTDYVVLWLFGLHNTYRQGGWLVQEVEWGSSRSPCSGRTVAKSDHYWEFWRVPAGERLPFTKRLPEGNPFILPDTDP